MRESERCLETALRASEPEARLVATRILDDTRAWQRWEVEHADIMRSVAGHRRREVQVGELKLRSFQLIHRAGVFEHLRDQQVRGDARRDIIRHLHPTRGYSEGVLTEHSNYLRAACSLLCARFVGAAVIEDGVFEDPLARYHELHADYMQAYFIATLGRGADAAERSRQRALLPYLKAKLGEQRRRLLRLPPLRPSLIIEPWLRQSHGDTQWLPTLGSPPRTDR
jgi:hypothetical protein